MKNYKKNLKSEAKNRIIEALEKAKETVLRNIKNLESDTTKSNELTRVCMFEETCLTVGVNKGSKFISSAIEPQEFTPEQAAELCRVIANGNGESPICVSPLEYYRARLVALIDCEAFV